jgi:GTP-binding protein LepA
MEIIQERLEREFNMTVITTVPNVSYFAYTKKNPETALVVNNPTDLPEPSKLDHVEEPFIKATIITKLILWVMSCPCISKSGIDYESDLSNYGTC